MLRRTLLATVVLVLALAHPLPRASAEAPTASYIALELHAMIAAADLAVVGTIAEVGEAVFQLDVEEVLAGETGQARGERLEVNRFRDWTCAWRWKPYAAGQRVLLLLRRWDPKYDSQYSRTAWRILSAGGEGEMPVYTLLPEKGGGTPSTLVMLRGNGMPRGKLTGPRCASPAPVDVPDGSVLGWSQPLDRVVAAVREWRATFHTAEFQWKAARLTGRIETRRSRDELLALQKSENPLLAHLARELALFVVHVTDEPEPGPK